MNWQLTNEIEPKMCWCNFSRAVCQRSVAHLAQFVGSGWGEFGKSENSRRLQSGHIEKFGVGFERSTQKSFECNIGISEKS